MPCDASLFRRLRAAVLGTAIVSFGLAVGASNAFAQATPSAAPDTAQAAPAGAAAPAEGPPIVTGSDSSAAPAAPADGAAAEPPADTRGLDEEIQNLKKDVVDLN